MKLQTTFAVVASLIVTTVASNINMADVLADVSKQATALDKKISSFNANTPLRTLEGIHLDSIRMASAIEKAASNVNAASKPISESDGKKILATVKAMQPIVLRILRELVSKKPQFKDFPGISTLVGKDLVNIIAHVSKLETAIVASAPYDLKPKDEDLEAALDTAVAKALGAYS